MLEKLSEIRRLVGNTPIAKLSLDGINLFAKLEYYNYTGSIKDRAAYYILNHAIKNGSISRNTVVIESSSGNLGVSLSLICKHLNLKFIAVIDPNINSAHKRVINLTAYKVICVEEPDHTGGYLITRIEKVKELCKQNKNYYWTNQYENPNNYLAYYHGLGKEICNLFDTLDFVFIGVSSGGTLTGLSLRLKEKFSNVKIIAVDVEGSIIFQSNPSKRYISGIGSSFKSPVIEKAIFDDYIVVSQKNIVKAAKDLLVEQSLFGGASAGAMYFAIKDSLKKNLFRKNNTVLFLCPDKGYAYIDNIYNNNWQKEKISEDLMIK